MAFRRILCAVDFSAGSREALRVAADLARQAHAGLALVHVYQPPAWTLSETGTPAVRLDELIDHEQAELARWRDEARGLGVEDVSAVFETGAPWDRIVATARDDARVDLVVVGTHGRTGIARALIGSVAEKVVRHAPCAVLAVRANVPRAGSSTIEE